MSIEDVKGYAGASAEDYADAVMNGDAPPATQGEAENADPLDGLAGRAEKDVKAAFRPSVLRAVLDLRTHDRGAYVELRARLKAVGVPVSEWDKALGEAEKVAEREARDEAERKKRQAEREQEEQLLHAA